MSEPIIHDEDDADEDEPSLFGSLGSEISTLRPCYDAPSKYAYIWPHEPYLSHVDSIDQIMEIEGAGES